MVNLTESENHVVEETSRMRFTLTHKPLDSQGHTPCSQKRTTDLPGREIWWWKTSKVGGAALKETRDGKRYTPWHTKTRSPQNVNDQLVRQRAPRGGKQPQCPAHRQGTRNPRGLAKAHLALAKAKANPRGTAKCVGKFKVPAA